MLILPFVPGLGAYRFSTQIESVEYAFDVRWNARAAAWYFDVLEQDGTPIAYGIKIVLGAYLGKIVIHRLFRTGVMVAIDTTRASREATFDDLGTRVEVRWFPLAEAFTRLTASGIDA